MLGFLESENLKNMLKLLTEEFNQNTLDFEIRRTDILITDAFSMNENYGIIYKLISHNVEYEIYVSFDDEYNFNDYFVLGCTGKKFDSREINKIKKLINEKEKRVLYAKEIEDEIFSYDH